MYWAFPGMRKVSIPHRYAENWPKIRMAWKRFTCVSIPHRYAENEAQRFMQQVGPMMFQSLIGMLKTQALHHHPPARRKWFQSLIGMLKTTLQLQPADRFHQFQSLIGMLKTKMERDFLKQIGQSFNPS